MREIRRIFVTHPQPPSYNMHVVYLKFEDAGFVVITDKLEHFYDLVDFEMNILTSIPIEGEAVAGSINVEFKAYYFVHSPYSPSDINSKPDNDED